VGLGLSVMATLAAYSAMNAARSAPEGSYAPGSLHPSSGPVTHAQPSCRGDRRARRLPVPKLRTQRGRHRVGTLRTLRRRTRRRGLRRRRSPSGQHPSGVVDDAHDAAVVRLRQARHRLIEAVRPQTPAPVGSDPWVLGAEVVRLLSHVRRALPPTSNGRVDLERALELVRQLAWGPDD
jgi:hypothetical protein